MFQKQAPTPTCAIFWKPQPHSSGFLNVNGADKLVNKAGSLGILIGLQDLTRHKYRHTKYLDKNVTMVSVCTGEHKTKKMINL